MIENNIQVFRGYETASLNWSAGSQYEFDYKSVMPGDGTKPAALACSKVTGNTFRAIPVPSTDKNSLQC